MSKKKEKVQKSEKGKNKEKAKNEAKANAPKPPKVVRDSFTMPENDYARIKWLKSKYLEYGVNVKKGELLRAGLHALDQMDKDQLLAVIERIERVKTGRPMK